MIYQINDTDGEAIGILGVEKCLETMQPDFYDKLSDLVRDTWANALDSDDFWETLIIFLEHRNIKANRVFMDFIDL